MVVITCHMFHIYIYYIFIHICIYIHVIESNIPLFTFSQAVKNNNNYTQTLIYIYIIVKQTKNGGILSPSAALNIISLLLKKLQRRKSIITDTAAAPST